MKTVRERIIDEILGRLAAFTDVGAGGVRIADVEQDADWISRQLADGRYAIELAVGHDEPGDNTMTIEDWKFPVGLTVHMPSPLPFDELAGVDVRMTTATCAARFNARVYVLYRGADTDPGRWTDEDGDTALETMPLGGGGVYFDDVLKTNVTEHAFLVHYRHRTGDPTLAV